MYLDTKLCFWKTVQRYSPYQAAWAAYGVLEDTQEKVIHHIVFQRIMLTFRNLRSVLHSNSISRVLNFAIVGDIVKFNTCNI